MPKFANSLLKSSGHCIFLWGDRRRLRRIISVRGFTLMEIIISLVLPGIVLALAIPSFQSYAVNENLRTAARDLIADFAIAKERAMAENINCTISFNLGDNQYTVTAGMNTQTKSLSNYGASIQSLIPSGVTVTFQTRGTVDPEVQLTLINPRGSTAMITGNLNGRAEVQFDMR